MKIFRWILCHLLSITLIVSCVLIFLSRDVLKDDFNRLTSGRSNSMAAEATSTSPEMEKSDSANQFNQQSDSGPDQAKVNIESVKATEKTDDAVNAVDPTVDQLVQNVGLENAANEVSADNLQTVKIVESEKKINDPWGTVLAGVNDGDVAVAEFGRDIQAAPAKPGPAEPSFPPENYDPESSSQTASESGVSAPVPTAKAEHKVSSDVFPAVVPEMLSAGTAEDSARAVMQSSPSQGHENIQGSKTNVQYPGDREYFTALENARRMLWDGKSATAQAALENLMFEYPNLPEAPADLGNLFLQRGDRDAAVWAYQNAIPRYLNLHRDQEAINLIKFVSQFDPAIAESLQKKYW